MRKSYEKAVPNQYRLATGTAHAARSDLTGQACIREMKEVFGVNTAKAKRMCDPRTGVKPNKYGWGV